MGTQADRQQKMPSDDQAPTRLGPLGRAARTAIDRIPLIQQATKSEAGQRVIQALRAALHLRQPIRFLMGSIFEPGIPGTYEVRGIRLKVVLRHRTNDALSFNEVFHRNAYAYPPEVEDWLGKLQGPLRVLDLGANIGMFATWVLAYQSEAQVISVEADPANAPSLRSISRVNNLSIPSLEIREVAASNRPGQVAFLSGAFIHSRVTDPGTEGTITVPQVDAFEMLAGIQMAKIDIEGSEWPILRDPRLAEASDLKVIAMEWHATEQVPEAIAKEAAHEALQNAGFRVVTERSEEPSCGVLWAVRSQ